jgi:hypothetical protein
VYGVFPSVYTRPLVVAEKTGITPSFGRNGFTAFRLYRSLSSPSPHG